MTMISILFLNVGIVSHAAMHDWNTFKKNNQDDTTELHFYAASGDIDRVCFLLKHEFNPNVTDKNGVTALHWASFNGHTEMVKILIEHGADINAQDTKGWAPLSYAYKGYESQAKKMELLKVFISLGADVNTVLNDSAWTPLFMAVDSGDVACINMLLEKKADVHARDINGNTIFRYATLRSTEAMMQLLLNAGADINVQDDMGQSPLFDACRDNLYEKAVFLIKSGAKVNSKGAPYEYLKMPTTIPCHIPKTEVSVPHFMISDGVSANADHGLTPLHIACFKGHEKIVNLLIECGADVNSADVRSGTTPLHIAVSQGDASVAQKLLDAGAKADSATKHIQTSVPQSLSVDKLYFIPGGITPLFSAITGGKLDIVKIIASPTNVNKKAGFLNITPLHYACKLGHFDIVKELVKHRADYTLKFGNEFGAIETALCHGHDEVAQYLRELVPFARVINLGISLKRLSDDMVIMPHETNGSFFEYVIRRKCESKDCQFSSVGGIFYKTLQGIKPVPASLRSQMPSNLLSNLKYDKCLKIKNEKDKTHSFPEEIEKEFGHWAWVVIDNPVQNTDAIGNKKKRFDLYATIAGSVYELSEDGSRVIGRHHNESPGVFEFKIRTNLYNSNGAECLHRFYAPKGIIGALGFGAQARAKNQKLLTQ